MQSIGTISTTLESLGQSHILKFAKELSKDDKENLLKYLAGFDFEKYVEYYEESSEGGKQHRLEPYMEPLPHKLYQSIAKTDDIDVEKYWIMGLKAIAKGELAVIVFGDDEEPPGDVIGMHYPSLPSGKSIFQLNAEKIERLQNLSKQYEGYVNVILWYVMINSNNGERVVEFFDNNNYFGLDKKNVVFFEQHLIPAFDMKGKIMMETKHDVLVRSNGTGGVFESIRDCHVIDNMTRRKIKFVMMHSMENLLLKTADPIFLGYCMAQRGDCGAKMVRKLSGSENSFTLCVVDGRCQAISSAELSPETVFKKKGDALVYDARTISNYFLTVEFLDKIVGILESRLYYHRVQGTFDSVNERGAKGANVGETLEKFIEDIFPFAEKLVLWEVMRKQEFSEIKPNPRTGNFASANAVQDFYNLQREFIINAGGEVRGKEIEISPLLSYFGEDLVFQNPARAFVAPINIEDDHENITPVPVVEKDKPTKPEGVLKGKRATPRATPKGSPRVTVQSATKMSAYLTPKDTPRDTPKGTPKTSPKGTPKGSLRGTPRSSFSSFASTPAGSFTSRSVGAVSPRGSLVELEVATSSGKKKILPKFQRSVTKKPVTSISATPSPVSVSPAGSLVDLNPGSGKKK